MSKKPLAEHYSIIDNPNMKEMNRVLLLKTPYTGIEYAYGNLQFKEIDGERVVKYIYEVYKNPNNLQLEGDRNFINLINGILDEVLDAVFTPKE